MTWISKTGIYYAFAEPFTEWHLFCTERPSASDRFSKDSLRQAAWSLLIVVTDAFHTFCDKSIIRVDSW